MITTITRAAVCCCALLVVSGVGAEIPALEREALIDFYRSTGGDGWARGAGWLGPAGTECAWHGVTCDAAETTVTGLILEENNLRGALSASLVNLGGLQYVNLRGNDLVSTAPWHEGYLVQLERLTKYGGHICLPHETNLCVNDGRFRVNVEWRDFDNNTGVGQAVLLTSDTGYFWFFRDTNVEMIIKVLDGSGINGHFWVFYGALSNVEYTLTVSDTVTGNSVSYVNPAYNFASVGDTEALPEDAVEEGAKHRVTTVDAGRWDPEAFALVTELARAERPLEEKAQLASCSPSATALCLNNDRFRVEVEWTDFAAATGVGTAVSLTSDTGYFWFFRDTNVELVVKVLDGRAFNEYFWVFYGALSNVEYTLTVTDTANGEVKTYANALGEFGSVGDTFAFHRP